MNTQEHLLKIILSPHLSEKANLLGEKNRQFTFKVLPKATKAQIKRAVELLFDAPVEKVQVLNVPGKLKRFKGRIGQRSDWKKAYVRLAPGKDINFLDAQQNSKA